MKTYKERCGDADRTKEGDAWRHLKTGKTVLVLGRNGPFGVSLKHESGRVTLKLNHYLASDYELITP